ncbi:Uncharacterised protein [Serratia entomophila]|nr:Uncharacterised protein [Serratia entomophila]
MAADSGVDLGAHRRLPSKTALSGATGQGRPVEARLTGTFVVADPPDNAGAARVFAQRTDGVKRGRGWRGRAFGPSNCRSLRQQINAGYLRQFILRRAYRDWIKKCQSGLTDRHYSRRLPFLLPPPQATVAAYPLLHGAKRAYSPGQRWQRSASASPSFNFACRSRSAVRSPSSITGW